MKAKHVGRIGNDSWHLVRDRVLMELKKQLSWSNSGASLFHFRDCSGVEVDGILERPDGRIVGIEVKASSTPRGDDFAGLRFLEERLGDRFAYGVPFNNAPEATPFGPKMVALPIERLWR